MNRTSRDARRAREGARPPRTPRDDASGASSAASSARLARHFPRSRPRQLAPLARASAPTCIIIHLSTLCNPACVENRVIKRIIRRARRVPRVRGTRHCGGVASSLLTRLTHTVRRLARLVSRARARCARQTTRDARARGGASRLAPPRAHEGGTSRE